MHFRPCIDIHNGKVKQIVGGSLTDQGNQAKENFTASENADYYAKMYQKDGLIGGHVILLNPVSSEYYRETKAQAILALGAYPKGLQVGGGIHAESRRVSGGGASPCDRNILCVPRREDKLGKYGKT